MAVKIVFFMDKFRLMACVATFLATINVMRCETFEMLKYGDFENWVTRNIPESHLIGGHTKQLYEIAPEAVIDGDKAYSNMGGSPWATSNIMAKVVGITKGSNAVFPDNRAPGNRCCKLTTLMENCKAIGLINVDVVVAGSITRCRCRKNPTVYIRRVSVKRKPIRVTTMPKSI